MEKELFSATWAEAWRRELEASDAYREAAKRWEGAVVLRMTAPDDGSGEDGEEPRAVWVDLHHGECREARPATSEDLSSAPYVIEADAGTWRSVLSGELNPLSGILKGELHLERGSVTRLARYATAAREMVEAAARATSGSRGGAARAPAPSQDPTVGSASAPDLGDAGDPGRPDGASPPSSGGRPAFRSTAPGGLDRESFPLRLWEKSKRLGTWNPSDVDLAPDARDWSSLEAGERDILMRLSSLFQAGEEAVTRDLLPFVRMVSEDGSLEEEMYLTAFLWEEAKHVDAFRRFFDEVAREDGDLSRYHTPAYRELFYEELPAALGRLAADRSPEARAEASVTYHLIVEGVLAETGYHTYATTLERRGILPGTLEMVRRVARDESRHLAYGVYFLSTLVAEHGEPAWRAVQRRMEVLLPLSVEIIEEAFDAYEVVPFGLEPSDFVDYALDQFRRRMDRVERARSGEIGSAFEVPGMG